MLMHEKSCVIPIIVYTGLSECKTEKSGMEQRRDFFARETRAWLAVNHNTSGPLRIELKSLLKLLRNKCARTFTPERLQLQPLVGWQVNKKNSAVCSTSNIHRKQKDRYKLHTAYSNN